MEHTRLGIPKEVLATQILPFLFPLTVEPSLSLTQFRTLMQIIQVPPLLPKLLSLMDSVATYP